MMSLRPEVMLKTGLKLGLALMFLLSPGRLLLPGGELVTPKSGGEIRLKAFGKTLNRDFDPAGHGYPVVIEHIYDGLVRLDQNLEIFPALADYWTVSEGGKRVLFYIRKGALFHNGQEVTAEDVKFSLERLFRLKSNPLFYLLASRIEGGEEFWQGRADEVSGLKILDRKTIEIDWKFPGITNFYFLAASFAKVLPKNLLLKEKGSFFEKPVGSGPFKFDYWLRNSRLDIIGIRLTRNERYYGRKPYLQAIEISPYFLLDDFFRNEVHIVPYLSYRISTNKYQILENNSLHVVYLFFSNHLPPFDRPEVRQALRVFLDRKALAALASSTSYYAQEMDSYLPPFLPGFWPKKEEEDLSLGRALEILRAAGLGNSARPQVVKLYFEIPQKEIMTGLYTQLKESLLPAGIKLELQGTSSLNYLREEKVPYLVYFDWFMDVPDPEFLLYPLFHSGSFLNQTYLHYRNSGLDDLLEAQRLMPSFDRRIILFQQMEEVLHKEVPAMPLFYYKERLAYQPYLRNLKPQTSGLFFVNLRNVWLDR
jgi:ABC-type transport system substrate-binding protein